MRLEVRDEAQQAVDVDVGNTNCLDCIGGQCVSHGRGWKKRTNLGEVLGDKKLDLLDDDNHILGDLGDLGDFNFNLDVSNLDLGVLSADIFGDLDLRVLDLRREPHYGNSHLLGLNRGLAEPGNSRRKADIRNGLDLGKVGGSGDGMGHGRASGKGHNGSGSEELHGDVGVGVCETVKDGAGDNVSKAR